MYIIEGTNLDGLKLGTSIVDEPPLVRINLPVGFCSLNDIGKLLLRCSHVICCKELLQRRHAALVNW